jgi:hypothetical protein
MASLFADPDFVRTAQIPADEDGPRAAGAMAQEQDRSVQEDGGNGEIPPRGIARIPSDLFGLGLDVSPL